MLVVYVLVFSYLESEVIDITVNKLGHICNICIFEVLPVLSSNFLLQLQFVLFLTCFYYLVVIAYCKCLYAGFFLRGGRLRFLKQKCHLD